MKFGRWGRCGSDQAKDFSIETRIRVQNERNNLSGGKLPLAFGVKNLAISRGKGTQQKTEEGGKKKKS